MSGMISMNLPVEIPSKKYNPPHAADVDHATEYIFPQTSIGNEEEILYKGTYSGQNLSRYTIPREPVSRQNIN